MSNIDENKKHIAGMINEVSKGGSQNQNIWIPDGDTVPEGFKINDNGFYKIKREKKGSEVLWVSVPFRIEGLSRDINNLRWGKYISFFNQDNIKTFLHVPDELLEEHQKLRKLLRSTGLKITTRDQRACLVDYLNNYITQRRVRVVEKYGWYNQVYVYPDEIFGANSRETFCPVELLGQHGYLQKGSLEDWKKKVASYCIGNSRLVFGVSAAFAAPLLELMGFEGGGVHLVGPSSIGKSIILIVVASALGDPVQYIFSWRTTDNALESTAMLRNDSLLILDEIGEMDSKSLGESAYMLANGSGKKRANRGGDGKQVKRWKILLLSNGEKTLSEHMEEGGKRAKAGQEIRLLSIPSEVGEYGAFENIHGYENSRSFVEALESNARSYYGVAGREFLKKFTANRTKYLSQVRAIIKEVEVELSKYITNTQIGRLAKRFAIIVAGGELATSLGCTGWSLGEAKKAAITCFEACISDWGNQTAEEKYLCDQVQGFFQQYSACRFISKNANEDDVRRIQRLAGYTLDREDGTGNKLYLVSTKVFKMELCKGISEVQAKKILGKKGWLLKGTKGWQQQHHIKHRNASDWFYVFGPKVFHGG